MVVNIQDDILKLHAMGLLSRLLQDKATRGSILWATDAYAHQGDGYSRGNEIRPQRITGENSDLIKTRARRAMEQRTERTRQHAEVFTPLWIVKKMCDAADTEWFGRKDGFWKTDEAGHICFPARRSWKHYVDARRMEITCGEAPFLVTRYDVETGEAIPVEDRIGLLDRKLRAVSENAKDLDEWKTWALRAAQAIYGYELQGDNLLIARVNLLCSVEEHMFYRWRQKPDKPWLERLCNVIAWNLWQMDGIKGCVPVLPKPTEEQLCLFPPEPQFEQGNLFGEAEEAEIACRLFDWRGDHSISYQMLREKGSEIMKFDFIIGNPPYQEDKEGTSDTPIYNLFIDEVFRISDRVELITPARFLFNAGKTPKAWNKKMLSDNHFKVLDYAQDSGTVFRGTRITGGISITYRDATQDYGAIEVFSQFAEIRSLSTKMHKQVQAGALPDIMILQNRLDLEVLYQDYPELKSVISSDGNERRIVSSAFNKLPIFKAAKDESLDMIAVFGLEGTGQNRTKKWSEKRYVEDNGNLYKYKIMVSKSNGGAGNLCDTPVRIVAEPFMLEPGVGYTQSFIGIGAFEQKDDADATLKYIKTKFVRCLLGILKITQDNPPDRWRFIPLQDFTPASDIDWSKSVAEIDRQLYAKYGLDDAEIAFIESHVKEMN